MSLGKARRYGEESHTRLAGKGIRVITRWAGIIFALSFIFSASAHAREGDFHSLVDPELSRWDIYLSYRLPDGYDGSVPKDENGEELAPVGFSSLTAQDVFSVHQEAGEDVVRVSGEIYGALITKQPYRNYHFRMKVRWGDTKWPPRLNRLKDTGILYHSIGEPGVEYFRSWMLSQEFQVMEGHMGDYWNQATSLIDIKAYPKEHLMSPVADLRADWLTIGAGGEHGEFAMRSANHESPDGEWTQLDLICFEGKSVHIVNGEVVMVLRNSRYLDERGEAQALQEGKIQLQSEATEAFFKDIEIKPLSEMPEAYAAYFE